MNTCPDCERILDPDSIRCGYCTADDADKTESEELT